jgi:hypothetical protein
MIVPDDLPVAVQLQFSDLELLLDALDPQRSSGVHRNASGRCRRVIALLRAALDVARGGEGVECRH